MEQLNIVVFGFGGVGKSASTINFIGGNYVSNKDPTNYRIHTQMGSKEVVVDILDTPCGLFPLNAVESVRLGDGFIVMYSITSNSSFLEVLELVEQIKSAKNEDFFPLVIVGNKCDLEEDRQVKTDRGIQQASKLNASFFETSAKFNINITETFQEVIRLIYRKRKEHTAKPNCVVN